MCGGEGLGVPCTMAIFLTVRPRRWVRTRPLLFLFLSMHSNSQRAMPSLLVFPLALTHPLARTRARTHTHTQPHTTRQVIELLRREFLRASLPLHVVPYGVVPTGHECGIIEVVPNTKSRAQLVGRERALGEKGRGGGRAGVGA